MVKIGLRKNSPPTSRKRSYFFVCSREQIRLVENGLYCQCRAFPVMFPASKATAPYEASLAYFPFGELVHVESTENKNSGTRLVSVRKRGSNSIMILTLISCKIHAFYSISQIKFVISLSHVRSCGFLIDGFRKQDADVKRTWKWRGPAKLHFRFSLRRRPRPRQDVNRVVFTSSSERQSFVLFIKNIWPQISQKSCYFVVHNYNVYWS